MAESVSDDKALPALIRLVGLAFGVPQVAGAAVDAIQVAKSVGRRIAPGRQNDVHSKILAAARAALSNYSYELRALPANEWDAAEYALAQSIRQIEPDRLVISAVVSSPELRRELIHGVGAPHRRRLFSEPATAIYDVLAATLSQCLATVYADDEAFLFATQRLLATEIERLRQSITDSEEDLSASYRKYTDLYLRSTLQAAANASISSPEVRSDRRTYPRARVEVPARVLEVGAVGSRSLSAQVLHSRDTVYAITGAAGSGKTTAMKALAIELSQRRIASCSPADRLPLFVDAAASNARPSQAYLEESVEATAGGKPPKGWLQAHLESGRFILLIDGLDLLGRTASDKYLQWAESLRRLHGPRGLQVLYATRASEYVPRTEPHAYALALSPLNAGERGRLVRNLFEVSYGAAATDAVPFTERLEADRAGRSIACNPLMLTLICSLHDEISLNDSEERVEMFDVLVRALSLADAPPSPMDEDATSALALLGLERPDLSIDRRRAIRYLRGRYSYEGHDAAQVIERLVQRSGHLELDGPILRFRFEALREYLAAKALGRMGMPDLAHLLSSAQDASHWQRSVVWLAYLLTASDRADLIDLLEATRGGSALPEAAVLALAHGTDRMNSDLVRQACTHLIPPRESASLSAISELGDLAVTYLRPILTSLDTEERARAIDALLLIGTPQAIASLAGLGKSASAHAWQLLAGVNVWASPQYAQALVDLASPANAKPHVLHLTNTKLLHCIDQFPPQVHLCVYLDFAVDDRPWESMEMRPSSRTIESLQIRNGSASDIASVAHYFPGASSVTFEDADFSAAAELPPGMHLPRSLRLVTTDSAIRHSVGWDTILRALSQSAGLERLSLHGGHAKYESLHGFDELHHLHVIDVSLSGSELRLPQLRALSMFASDLEDFLALENCTKLESVSVASMPGLFSCEGIQTLPMLSSVSISDCSGLLDVSALAEVASGLTELSIAGCPAVDLHLSGLADVLVEMSDGARSSRPDTDDDRFGQPDDIDDEEDVSGSDDSEPPQLREILLSSIPTRLRGHDRLLVDGRELDGLNRTASEEEAKRLRRLVEEQMTRDEAIELSRLMWLGAR